jgi:hypothetical protein
MALNPSGQISIGGPTVGQSINLELGLSATANSSLNQANFRTLAGIPSGTIALSNFYGKSNGTQKSLYWASSIGTWVLGSNGLFTSVANTIPTLLGAGGATYGGDKGQFFGGQTPTPVNQSVCATATSTNTGTISALVNIAQTRVMQTTGASYGNGTTIFGWGQSGPTSTAGTNVINYGLSTGGVAASTTTAGNVLRFRSSSSIGTQQAFFAFGSGPAAAFPLSINWNVITTAGVVGANVATSGPTRVTAAAVAYGNGNCIIASGRTQANNPVGNVQQANNITNALVFGSAYSIAGTTAYARDRPCGSTYGAGSGVIFGGNSPQLSPSNLAAQRYNYISNTGVFGADVTNTTLPASNTIANQNSQSAGISFTA